MKKIIIITGDELRHEFFRKFLASEADIKVLKTFCEVPKKSILHTVLEDAENENRNEHLIMRSQTEKDFFESFCLKIEDESNPDFIEKGTINNISLINDIISLNPDLIISYGCSIIDEPLINHFKNRFVNIHLGLSPYYRGAGTNFFPFVNNEVQCAGVTLMHIDAGIDTGKIIHQQRSTIIYGDNIHQIGNRLIKEMTVVCTKLIRNFDVIMNDSKNNSLLPGTVTEKYYKKKDFTEESVKLMYSNFSNGIIGNYIRNKKELDAAFPIIENPLLT